MKKVCILVLMLTTIAAATPEFIDSLLVNNILIRGVVESVFGDWELVPKEDMPQGVGVYVHGNTWGPRRHFVGLDGSGLMFSQIPGSMNTFLMTGPNLSNTIYWGAMPVDEMPNTDWDYLIDHHQFSLYYDPEFNVLKLRDSTRVVFEIDQDDHLFAIEGYDFFVWNMLSADSILTNSVQSNSIVAGNAANETDWVVQVGDTIDIVGGVILGISHP